MVWMDLELNFSNYFTSVLIVLKSRFVLRRLRRLEVLPQRRNKTGLRQEGKIARLVAGGVACGEWCRMGRGRGGTRGTTYGAAAFG